MSNPTPSQLLDASPYVTHANAHIIDVQKMGSLSDNIVRPNERPTTKYVTTLLIASKTPLNTALPYTTASNPCIAATVISGVINTRYITCTSVDTRGLPRERYISLL